MTMPKIKIEIFNKVSSPRFICENFQCSGLDREFAEPPAVPI
jgi:hypothetical protein